MDAADSSSSAPVPPVAHPVSPGSKPVAPDGAVVPPVPASASTAIGDASVDGVNKRQRATGWRKLDDYERDRRLGEGTFGEVFRARVKATGQPVALKLIKPGEQDQHGFPVTSVREVRVLKAMDHENIVKLLDVVLGPALPGSRLPSTVYMVFELCDYDLTGLSDRPGYQLSQAHIRCYMKQILEGINYMHSNNYIHRDIKGPNILITKDHVVKIADFGLARRMIDPKLFPRMTACNMRLYTQRVVTPWWRPPEVFLGDDKYTEKVDMWSIGCVFGELLAGEALFPGNNLDVLKVIFEHCGTPTRESWPGHDSLPLAAEALPAYPMPARLIRRLQERFPRLASAPRESLDLLEKLLVLNPERRLSASQALAHDYFRSGGSDDRFLTSQELREMLPPFEFESSMTLAVQELRAKQREEARAGGGRLPAPQPLHKPAAVNGVTAPPAPAVSAAMTVDGASLPPPPPPPVGTAAPRSRLPASKPKVKQPDVDLSELGAFGIGEFTTRTAKKPATKATIAAASAPAPAPVVTTSSAPALAPLPASCNASAVTAMHTPPVVMNP